ncbi:hypothetical protein ACTA71_010395 [Dictyostelium dimigraforme]
MDNEKEDLIKLNIREITKQDKEIYEKKGYLVLENILPDKKQVEKLLKRAKDCFNYGYDKGIAPDEVSWRPGLSLNDKTREMVNCWKSDSLMAQLVLNEDIGKLACDILECDSVIIAQDDIFWKPVDGKSIGMHQDYPYFECMSKKVLTVWIALTDVSKENGTLEFVEGSHKWKDLPIKNDGGSDSNNGNESYINNEFHAPDNYLKGLDGAIQCNGFNSIDELAIHPVTVKAGGCSIHHGKLWHGSNSNPSSFKERVSIAIHFAPGDSVFSDTVKPCFSFGRYKLYLSNKLEETFYPITFSKNGYRSPNIPDALKK